VKNGAPVVAIYDSNGAKVSDGLAVLAEFSNILKAANELSGVVPQVAVAAGSCVGVSALMARAADIVVAAKDAVIYLTDAKGEVSAEEAAKCGYADILADDAMAAEEKARELISVLPLNNLSVAPVLEGAAAEGDIDTTACVCCNSKAICDADSFIELKKDFGTAKTAIASIGGIGVGVVALCGTLGLKENEKIASFIRFCDCFNIPVVTFADSEGFCKKNPSKASVAAAASKLSKAYASATTPMLAVYTGKVVGALCVALSACDYRIAWPSATISAMEPATAVEFFWHDRLKGAEDVKKLRAELEEEYAATEANVFAAMKASLVEDVVAPEGTRDALISALDMMASKRAVSLPKKHSN